MRVPTPTPSPVRVGTGRASPGTCRGPVSLALGGVVIFVVAPGTGLAGHRVVLVAVPELAQGGGVGLAGAGGAVAEAGERRAHFHPLGCQRALDGLAQLRAPRTRGRAAPGAPLRAPPTTPTPPASLTSLRDTMPTRRPMLVTYAWSRPSSEKMVWVCKKRGLSWESRGGSGWRSVEGAGAPCAARCAPPAGRARGRSWRC